MNLSTRMPCNKYGCCNFLIIKAISSEILVTFFFFSYIFLYRGKFSFFPLWKLYFNLYLAEDSCKNIILIVVYYKIILYYYRLTKFHWGATGWFVILEMFNF